MFHFQPIKSDQIQIDIQTSILGNDEKVKIEDDLNNTNNLSVPETTNQIGIAKEELTETIAQEIQEKIVETQNNDNIQMEQEDDVDSSPDSDLEDDEKNSSHVTSLPSSFISNEESIPTLTIKKSVDRSGSDSSKTVMRIDISSVKKKKEDKERKSDDGSVKEKHKDKHHKEKKKKKKKHKNKHKHHKHKHHSTDQE